ncbi:MULTISPECIES: nucleoside hydrolase [unclassified Corynebacterium]|uniref:nucleoside hydrolase n=1 Tax=unclassified Corynebacterium TaxID=2624378 RepID=UPI00216AB27D|nr:MULTISPECIES: nucleoside hydrolase [unclassified Corynebacterium]MCS4489857.1 nucleoside hydrolase [Corynebacterium sp. ES2775-CONJ]MCS4491779.1 nucleoside hydrolase [Corynebacterium sp. ES2715-CONJ3]MCS4531884.1 nucleoside hydrolase [Corynebacterium sp. ES2730-CONJ]
MNYALRSVPRVLLDCDTGIDDALALIYLGALHRAGEIELQAVTTTAGNAEADLCAENSAYILSRVGVEGVDIAVGQHQPVVVDLVTTPETHGPRGLGYITDVSETSKPAESSYPGISLENAPAAWRKLWQKAVDSCAHVIVTGPATNLATWLADRPWPSTVTIMGGAYFYPGNTTPTAEWNTWVDPHAAKDVFALAPGDQRVTVCSLGVTEQMVITPQRLDRYGEIVGSHPIAKVLREALRFYFEFHEAQGEGYLAQVHDLLTVMVALGKVETTWRLSTVDVECEGMMRGTTVADLRGHWGRDPSVRLVESVDIDAAHEEFERVLTVLAKLSKPALG